MAGNTRAIEDVRLARHSIDRASRTDAPARLTFFRTRLQDARILVEVTDELDELIEEGHRWAEALAAEIARPRSAAADIERARASFHAIMDQLERAIADADTSSYGRALGR